MFSQVQFPFQLQKFQTLQVTFPLLSDWQSGIPLLPAFGLMLPL